MGFSEKQYYQSLDSNENVKQAFIQITDACKKLQSQTGCPDDDIDEFLRFITRKWK